MSDGWKSTMVVRVEDELGGRDQRVTVEREDGVHTVTGTLTNELVIHPYGGIYLRLMIRARRDG